MKSAESKRFRNGSYSSVLTVIVIAVLIIVNGIVGSLPTTWTKPDFSEQQMLRLSSQTVEMVKGLTEDVTIYHITQEGKEDLILGELLEKYASLSSKIRLETVDSALHPTFAAKYTTGGLADNSLIVESNKRAKVVPYAEIYQAKTGYNENNQMVQTTDFDGENQLTNAIDFVLSDQLPVAYQVSGHSESVLSDELISQINGQNIDIQMLDLVQAKEIPADCSALIFNAPKKDLTETELTLLTEYFEQGGSVLLIETAEAEDTPNFDAFLQEYGVGVVDGMVCEGDTGHTLQNAPYMVYTQIGEHTITQPLLEENMNVFVAMAQPIVYVMTDSSVTAKRILTTTSKGYVKTTGSATTEKEDGDETGALNVGLALEKAGNGETSGKLVLYSTPLIVDADANAYSAGGNYDLLINSFGWMCEHESAIAIHAKSLDGTQLRVSSGQANFWSAIVVVVVPVVLIVAGLSVWLIRRRR